MSIKNHRINCCERYCTHFFIALLQVLNLLDFLLAAILIFVGIHVYDKAQANKDNCNIITQFAPIWAVMVGIFLILQVFLSCCAAATPGCRCLATPSAYLSMLVAVCSLSLAISSYIDKISIFNYLNERGSIDLDVTPSEIKTFEINFDIFNSVLLVITFMQIFRYCIGISFQNSLYRLDNEYEMLQHDKVMNDLYSLSSSEIQIQPTTANLREEKYKVLKNYYHDKYTKLGAENEHEINEASQLIDDSQYNHHDIDHVVAATDCYQYSARTSVDNESESACTSFDGILHSAAGTTHTSTSPPSVASPTQVRVSTNIDHHKRYGVPLIGLVNR